MSSSRVPNRVFSTASVAIALGALLALGLLSGAALADDHTRDEAPHYGPDEKGNATFEFLEQEGHYPGADDVDVRYTMKGGEVYEDVGASDGIAADRFVVQTDAVDHSDCDTENVATFAIDRDDDGEYDRDSDEDLLQYTKTAMYFDDGVVVEFYDYRDFAEDPPVVHADDRIILELSDEAADGACADTTDERGWYSAETFLNGTGPRDQNRSDEQYGFTIESEHNYVCECEDEEEARERLGTDPTTPTETPDDSETPTPTETPPSADDTPTETATATPVVTATVNESVGDATVSANGSVGEDGGSADVSVEASGGDDRLSDPPSPTPGDAPGFGVGVAAAALLCGGLLARRRADRGYRPR